MHINHNSKAHEISLQIQQIISAFDSRPDCVGEQFRWNLEVLKSQLEQGVIGYQKAMVALACLGFHFANRYVEKELPDVFAEIQRWHEVADEISEKISSS